MAQFGAGRQVENDCIASVLVQVLGVKESADLQEGFGFFVQHLLSGGLEKAHAEEKGRGEARGKGPEKTHGEEGWTGKEAAEKAQGEEGRADGEVMDRGGGMEKEEEQGGALASGAANGAAGEGGRGGKNAQWRENLNGRVWERYVDGMAWILEHGGGEGKEFRCSHCIDEGSKNGGDVQVNGVPKGMYVSGVGATDFALACATELSKPESCAEACMYILDGNNANKCFRDYYLLLPSIALIAKFAYRPPYVLFNRFLSVFPPHSFGFHTLVKDMGLPPLPSGPASPINLAILRGEIEKERVTFLLLVALKWPASILELEQFDGKELLEGDGIRVKKKVATGRKKGKARRGMGNGGEEEEEEDDGEVWEELESWCFTAQNAWPSSLRVSLRDAGVESEGSGLSDVCMGSEGQQERADMDTRIADLVSTEMLLGEPCYRPASPASPSVPPGVNTTGAATSTTASASSSLAAPTNVAPKTAASSTHPPVDTLATRPRYDASSTHVTPTTAAATGTAGTAAPVADAEASAPNACRERRCEAAGCGRMEGGGVNLRSCGGCGKVAYCSRECQKAHWPSHKLTCSGWSSGKEGVSRSGKPARACYSRALQPASPAARACRAARAPCCPRTPCCPRALQPASPAARACPAASAPCCPRALLLARALLPARPAARAPCCQRAPYCPRALCCPRALLLALDLLPTRPAARAPCCLCAPCSPHALPCVQRRPTA
ncbi:unnamed protein product [Closterium sp. Naga37s-1]|nr:unnamed protein product [Closterium sp. Naga37s-1]